MISLPRQFARTRRFTLGAPSQFTVAADGSRVLFLRSRAGDDPVSCLWSLDLDTGLERLVADPGADVGELPEEERVRRERARVQGAGIVGYATDAATRIAVYALSGALWVVDVASGAARRLPTAGPAVDPRPDPTGTTIGYACAGALRVIGVDGAGDRPVAAPDGPDVVFGLAEHVASESMGRYRGYWWSPDGSRLLVARVDSSAVAVWYIADPAEPARPPRAVRYPTVGTVNADVTLWLVDLDGAATEVRWDRAGFEYLTAAGWDGSGPYAAVQSRDQRTVQVLAVDPADGSTALLAEQRDDCWVQLVPGLPARTASGALVSHLDGATRQLTVDGTPVSPPDVHLDEVLGVDGDEVLFTAYVGDDVQLWSWADGRARRLTDQPGVHSGTMRAGTSVHVTRTPDQPGAQVTVHRAGQALTIASHAEPPVLPLRVTRLALGDRALPSLLFLPSWHRPGTRLPVLLDPYGGAGMRRVRAEQAPLSFVSQWFAEQGFAVLVTDGSGTPGRSPDWDREVHGDTFSTVLDDQVTALTEAARSHPDLDLARVAIRGWSYGGSLAALAVLRRPDVFHAAVAGAGVTDQLLYDTHWRERFLGHPDEHPERYAACSLILAAPRLSRPLLLVHGLADDNVFLVNTLRFSTALLAAGKPHEVLPLSGVTHLGADETTMENLLLHQVDFLRRSLPPPP